ncbi:Fic family protein [Campylobacter jejuni]|uniref:Fic family protein n=1 Tax=Campylobacter jejuni TaxID=197 RepID=UPI000F80B3DE|nr:Fic family protein [Campylobacter jejuni]RTJ12798.1 cell filamentation protein Fic [Campylobacter jejuni]RTJ43882.1 cell filamentation protein Fic [Campylobacter jejuni]
MNNKIEIMEHEEYQEYKKNKNINYENILIGIGLNQVDNLKPSEYFYKAVKNSSNYEELEEKIIEYYKNADNEEIARTKECDLVSQRIAKIIDDEGFSFSPITLKSIHRKMFTNVFLQVMEKYVGKFRKVNIFKEETVLNGKSVNYANYDDILEFLEYDFEKEKKNDYSKMSNDELVEKISSFVSNIWQIHPFREGNTRTIGVFVIKYLNSIGFKTNNDIFKENSKYFRNALVLSNYADKDKSIDISYLESFFKKLLIDKNLELKKMK